MSGPWRRSLVPIAVLFALCVGFYWKILLTDQYTYLDSPDLAYMELPRYQFLSTQVRHLAAPLWDPHLWCGQPFLAQFTGAAYPLNWILPPLKFQDGKVSIALMHWFYLLIHFQGALFAFLLCRDLGRSRTASVLGGLVFTLASFMGETDWPQVLNGAVWAPAVVLFLLRAVRGTSAPAAVLSGVCLGMAFLSGHHEAPVYIAVAAAALWTWHIFKDGRPRLAMVALAALCFGVAALTSGLQTVPGVEYGKLAQRWAGWPDPLRWDQPIPYTVHESFSFTPASLPAIFLAGAPFAHVNPFVGVAAFTLAILGILVGWKREPGLRLFAALALGALLFAMAAHTWLHGLLYSTLPFFGKARVPARALIIFNLAMAPLAAYGLDAVRRNAASPWLRRAALTLAACAAAGFIASTAAWMAAKPLGDARLMVSVLAALLLAVLLAAWRANAIGERTLGAAAILLCLWELGNVTTARLPNQRLKDRPSPLAQLRGNGDIGSFLRGQPGPFRVSVNDKDLEANIGPWEGIHTLQGYMAGVTANIASIEPHARSIQDLLNVEFYVASQPQWQDQQELFAGESGLKVFRNPGAFPRARIVHEAVAVPSDGHRRILYADPAFDLRRKTAFVSKPPALEACAEDGERVAVTRYDANRVEIDAHLNCRGMVILADTWFPGWRATVDGAPAEILEADGALRGVVLEKGAHRIVMKYRPVPVYVGAAMTLSGWLAGIVAFLLMRRRKDSEQAAVTAA